MALSPAASEHLLHCAQAMASAPRGATGALIDAAAQATGLSRASVYRHLRALTVRPERRQRSDAGQCSVTRAEAAAISAVVVEAMRKNNKALMTVSAALRALRYDGTVRCEALDPTTGELRPLSAATVTRALRSYGLHPKQLLRAAPAVELRSEHPNYCWQIDASLCVLYYLRAERPAGRAGRRAQHGRASGLQVLDADRFYKNKPAALERVESERVWRYVVTDHRSGSIFVHYVLGAESGMNLAESFMEAISQRTVAGQADPFHGVPFILMMDMGSANTSGLFKNLARRLGVRLIPHAPGNARATGQVEKAQDIVERHFESALKFQPVNSLEELNLNARCWARHFNATAIHSRHGKTRTEVWMHITAEQLRIAPPREVLQQLLTHTPELRKVNNNQTVDFMRREWDVSGVPGVMVGEKVRIAINPYTQDCASVVEIGADGQELLYPAPLVQRDEAGQRTDAPVIGQSWARPPETALQANRRDIERLITGAETDEAAAQARKAKALPFGGRFDPLREARETKLPVFLPRRGTELQPTAQGPAQTAQPATLTLFEAAAALAAPEHVGQPLTREQLALLRSLHPTGVPEDQLAPLTTRLKARAGLRLVNGGG